MAYIGGSAEEHPMWKGGVDPAFYRKRAFEAYGRACARCGTEEEEDHNIHVHHRDRNRKNGDVANLEVLCRTCHMKEHHGKRVVWHCQRCGKQRLLRPFRAKRQKYCGHECRMLAMRSSDGTFGGRS